MVSNHFHTHTHRKIIRSHNEWKNTVSIKVISQVEGQFHHTVKQGTVNLHLLGQLMCYVTGQSGGLMKSRMKDCYPWILGEQRRAESVNNLTSWHYIM